MKLMVIRSVRGHGNERDYSATNGEAEYFFVSKETVYSSSIIEIEGEVQNQKILVKKLTIIKGNEAKQIENEIEKKLIENTQLSDRLPILDLEITKKLWPKIKEAAAKIMVAKKLGRPTIIRFHGDADGICSALAISSITYARAYQQNSAIYSVRDALFDIDTIGQEIRPLAIFVDFGSADANHEGIKLLQAAGIEVIIIDHHPYSKPNPAWLLNPLDVDPENGSKYCAGYLCAEIAASSGADKTKMVLLAKASAAGDKSDILNIEEADITKALVLDFLAAHSSFGNKLEFYKNVLSKEELYNSLAKQAEEEIAEAAKKVISTIKEERVGKIVVFSFSLESVVTKGEWPPSSKITTRVFDSIIKERADEAILVIGYNPRTIIMRINDKGVEAGLDSNTMAKQIIQTMPDFVESGGGHTRAGSIRVKEGFVKEVLSQVLKQV
jgi:RecJ-like exonuclease